MLSFELNTHLLFGRVLGRLLNEYQCHELASEVCK